MGRSLQPKFASEVGNLHFMAEAGSDGHREFRLLAECIPNLAWIAHADGWIYWYNRRWFEYTGTTPKDMEGWGWQTVHDPARLPGVLVRWQASIATGEPFEMIFPLKGADGLFRMFLTRVVPLKDEEGKVLRWFGTNTDFSDQYQTASALRESEQRFRTATEAVSGVLWTNDLNGEMQGEQKGWSGFTGQTSEQYSGYGWASAIHPEDAQPTIDAWQTAVRENRLFSFEHRVRRYDGVYRLCSIRALPIRNEDGSIREWVGVHTDITEDRERQQRLNDTVAALRQQQELVEAAQLTNNAGFWRYQPSDGNLYLSSGSRRLLSLPASGEVSLEDIYSGMHPEDQARARSAMDEGLTSGEFRIEYRTAESATGEFRWILSVARVLCSNEDEPYFVGMQMDISQQKRSAEALIRTEKLAVAGRLAATIAHEINNPLEAVANLLYLLRDSPLDDEQRSYCTTIQDELRRVSEITTHTLRFHRQNTRRTQIKVEDLMRSVLGLFDSRLRNVGIATECRFRNAREVFGFDGEIRQVLANLVGNAIDALNGSDTRLLLLRTQEGTDLISGRPGVFITIADRGPGISPSALARIFDPFFTTKGEIGTGLGLWVSSEIILKHRGKLRVRSTQSPSRHGSVFRLFLPSDALEG